MSSQIMYLDGLARADMFQKLGTFDAIRVRSYLDSFVSIVQYIQDWELLNSTPVKFVPVCCAPRDEDFGDLQLSCLLCL